MIRSSLRSSAEALVHIGRAPRRVSAIVPSATSATRVVAVGALTVLAGLLFTPVASADPGGDPEVAAVVDQVAPALPGVTLSVQTTGLGSQFVLDNPTKTQVTIMSRDGDPLFRVGPGGVLGNFRSPDWYTSKAPDTDVTIPKEAKAKGTPVWVRVSDDPAWGWFDRRLTGVSLTQQQKDDATPLQAFGSWTVPLMYGDALGSVDGHFQYRPPLGSFAPTLSNTTPAPGVTLTAMPGNPTPAISLDNAGPSEVVVLGDQQEPYLRITAKGSEVNQISPTWIASQNPGATPPPASGPPQWEPVGTNGLYSFTLNRAGPDVNLASLYEISSPQVVRDWTVSLLVDGKRIDVPGQTTMTPNGYTDSGWGNWAIAGVVAAALVVIGAAIWFLRRRRGTPPTPPKAHDREPVGANT